MPTTPQLRPGRTCDASVGLSFGSVSTWHGIEPSLPASTPPPSGSAPSPPASSPGGGPPLPSPPLLEPASGPAPPLSNRSRSKRREQPPSSITDAIHTSRRIDGTRSIPHD